MEQWPQRGMVKASGSGVNGPGSEGLPPPWFGGNRMIHIQKHFVTDEHNRPIAVQVRYEDWLEIEKLLDTQEEPGATTDIMRHAGVLTLTQDPLEYQQEVRGEWG